MSERKGRTAVSAFVASGIGSFGLMVTYLLGGQPQAEGVFIFVALGGLGLGLILWAKDFMPEGGSVQERSPTPSPSAEREHVAEDIEAGAEEVGRRGFIGRALAGAAGMLGLAALFPIRSLGEAPGDSLIRTQFRTGVRLVTNDGLPIAADELGSGSFLTVFPEGDTHSGDSVAVLIRMDPDRISDEGGADTTDGFVAYSKICTHAGCPVGLYESETNELFCPCHQSTFDAANHARPTSGPATRPLPRLPIAIDDEGFLVATGDFSAPIGPGFWSL